MLAHRGQRDGRAVGHAEQVPLPDSHRSSEISDVVRHRDGVVLAQIDAGATKAIATREQRVAEHLSLCVEGVRRTEDGCRRLVHLGAVERRIRSSGSTLVEQDHVAVARLAVLQESSGVGQPRVPGPSREVHHRVGRRVRVLRVHGGHRQHNLSRVGLRAILRNGQRAALDARVLGYLVVARRLREHWRVLRSRRRRRGGCRRRARRLPGGAGRDHHQDHEQGHLSHRSVPFAIRKPRARSAFG